MFFDARGQVFTDQLSCWHATLATGMQARCMKRMQEDVRQAAHVLLRLQSESCTCESKQDCWWRSTEQSKMCGHTFLLRQEVVCGNGTRMQRQIYIQTQIPNETSTIKAHVLTL